MTAPTKRAPRKRPPAKAAEPEVVEGDAPDDLAGLAPSDDGPIGHDGEIRAVRIGKRGRTPNPMVDLFELGGKMYQIPAKPSPALILKFMREARNPKVGTDQATENMMVTLLGQGALDALAESPEVTEDDVADIFKIVAHIAFGEFKALEKAARP